MAIILPHGVLFRGGAEERIPMERIAEEGCNLNISRYISTAVQEEEIDLAKTHGELVKVESAIHKATIKHHEFLKELGLSPLPSSGSSSSRK